MNTEKICNACGCVIETEAVEIDGLFYCKDCYENEELWYECAHCGKRMFADDVKIQSDDGKYFCCEGCMEDSGYFMCCYCEEIHPVENMIEVGHGYHTSKYCSEDCAESDDNIKCVDCGEWISYSDVNWVRMGINEEPVCDTCLNNGNYFYCNHCERYYSDRYLWNYDDDFYVCDYCADNYAVCEDCGHIVHVDDAHYIGGCYYCDECADENSDYGGDINDWNYKPDPTFYESKDDDDDEYLYMGVELEVDKGSSPRSLASELYDNYEEIYCKHDGSLSCGVEIVSHPCTLKYHTNELDWKGIMNMALNRDFKSHDAGTCGLHVHVNRDFFGYRKDDQDLQIAKIILIVNRFWDSHIVPFTRRRTGDINQWAKKNEVGKIYDKDEVAVKRTKTINGSNNMGRYVAVNLQNYNTIEFRIFRGTLKYSTFIATLQFVDTICRFAKTISIDDVDNIKWEDIFAGVDYAELNSYLAERTDFKPDLATTVFIERPAIKEKTRHDVKIGDRVVVRDYIEMQPDLNAADEYFVKDMAYMCGETGVVTDVYDNNGRTEIRIRFDRVGISQDFYYLTPNMIDIVF